MTSSISSLVKVKKGFRSDVLTVVWSHWHCSPPPGEAGASLGLRLELGPWSIRDLIKALAPAWLLVLIDYL